MALFELTSLSDLTLLIFVLAFIMKYTIAKESRGLKFLFLGGMISFLISVIPINSWNSLLNATIPTSVSRIIDVVATTVIFFVLLIGIIMMLFEIFKNDNNKQ